MNPGSRASSSTTLATTVVVDVRPQHPVPLRLPLRRQPATFLPRSQLTMSATFLEYNLCLPTEVSYAQRLR
jgi:hypothetical protein